MDEFKELPWDKEAERAVLGGILLDPKFLFIVLAIIRTEDIYLTAHRNIFTAMQRLQSAGLAIDALTIKSELQKADQLEQSGGLSYVGLLSDGIPAALNIESYCKIIKEKSRLRQAIAACAETEARCFQAQDDSADIVADHQKRIRAICGANGDGFHAGLDAINDTFDFIIKRKDNPNKVTGIPTGIQPLDDITTGFQPGDLIVMSAKTGFGKTALALNAATHAMLRDNRKVVIFSLEMSREQLGTRMISSESGIDSYLLRTGHFNRDLWPVITRTADRIANCKFWVHDKSIALAELDAWTRRTQEEHGLDLVVVDYLQLVTVGGTRKIENRTQEVTEVSRGLKAIASDLHIPVVALSQENEQGETRESRAIEHDASLFLSIEMDREQLKTTAQVPAKIQIRKNRNGSLGTVEVVFEKAITRFKAKA
jgi:replicative DNA helicase